MEKIIENNQLVDINQLKANDYNPKPDYKETEELQLEFGKIKNSLEYHGQINPILVRELGNGIFEIVNGFHRWKAMQELGFEKVEVKNLGKITREEAIKKALATEELRIPLDMIEVAKLVKGLKELGVGLEGLPYSMEEIDNKIDLLGFNWDEFNQDKIEDEEVLDMTTLSFLVTEEQKGIIIQAINKIKESNPSIKDGRSLELICIEFINAPEGTTGLSQ